MKKTLIIAIVAVLVLTAGGYFFFARGGKSKYEFRFDKVSVGDLAVNVTATGAINPVTSVDVGTQVSGTISKLYADFNSIVKEGQIIAQLDPTFLKQSVNNAEANLQKAQAQLNDSKRVLDRVKTLLDKQLETQENYDASLTTYESNLASIKQAQAQLDQAKINLSYATIYAPINGVVIDRKVNVGQTVAASLSSPTLFTIANDLHKMQVETTVDESDIGNVSIGQTATFTVDAYPEETFSGTVSQIRLAPQSIQNVVNYTVIIQVNNDQLKLMPGMTANVKILVASDKGVLRVPNMALRFQPPAALVDSAKIKEMRAKFSDRRGPGQGAPADSVKPGMGHPQGTAAAPDSSHGGAATAEGGRERFRALRDSINAAHGGNMSREELRREMAKVLDRQQAAPDTPAPAAQQQTMRPGEGTRFGIIQTYPEYQKSGYTPSHDSGMGKVWILNAQKKLEPIYVRTGLTDGKYTEINSGNLKEGEQLVIGASSNGNTTEQARSPFQQGGRQMGGRPF